jgi:CO dehydrogenase maturation factor
MTTTIAVAGKGGVGKTTLSALVIKHLGETDGPVLAIDADPSSNLNMALGLDLEQTVGEIREGLLASVRGGGGAPAGMAKSDYLDYEVRSSLVEGVDFDLITMGRPEGPGCYCAVNNTLRRVIDEISANYRYVVIDNEAGMEHLSRRTTRDVDHLLVVSDPTRQGLVAADRIGELQHELDIRVEQAHLVLNRTRGDLPEVVSQIIEDMDLPLLGVVPESSDIAEYELIGRPLVEMDSDSILCASVARLLEGAL